MREPRNIALSISQPAEFLPYASAARSDAVFAEHRLAKLLRSSSCVNVGCMKT
jgi:hypothetical protein